MIRLRDILKMFPSYQLISLADKQGSQFPYGHRDKISDLNNLPTAYENAEVLNMRIVSEVLYIRIKL